MSIKKSATILFIVSFVCSGCLEQHKIDRTRPEKEQILDAAKAYFKTKDSNLDNIEFIYDEKNQEWLKTFDLMKKHPDGHYRRLQWSLKGYDYQVVRYQPNKTNETRMFGGSGWIFVDKKSKKVIDFLGYK